MNYRRVFIKNGLVFLTIVTNDRAYSILPEHIHCIIKPTIIEEYSKIVKSFKYSFTKNYNVGLVNPTYLLEDTEDLTEDLNQAFKKSF